MPRERQETVLLLNSTYQNMLQARIKPSGAVGARLRLASTVRRGLVDSFSIFPSCGERMVIRMTRCLALRLLSTKRPFHAHVKRRCSRTRFAQTPSQRLYSRLRSPSAQSMLRCDKRVIRCQCCSPHSRLLQSSHMSGPVVVRSAQKALPDRQRLITKKYVHK